MWLLFMGVFFGCFLALERQPAKDPSAASIDFIEPPEGTLHVLMGLHPKCPCTSNSVVALKRLMRTAGREAPCTILAMAPSTTDASWIETDNLALARNIPRATIVIDSDAQRSRELGIHASGGVMIVDARGQVAFRGGITAGRNCPLAGPGLDVAARALSGERLGPQQFPVFGCPLLAEAP